MLTANALAVLYANQPANVSLWYSYFVEARLHNLGNTSISDNAVVYYDLLYKLLRLFLMSLTKDYKNYTEKLQRPRALVCRLAVPSVVITQDLNSSDLRVGREVVESRETNSRVKMVSRACICFLFFYSTVSCNPHKVYVSFNHFVSVL